MSPHYPFRPFTPCHSPCGSSKAFYGRRTSIEVETTEFQALLDQCYMYAQELVKNPFAMRVICSILP